MLDNQNELLAEIAKIIGSLRPPSEPITLTTNIGRDLGLDSVEVMDFVMILEDRFDISIPLDNIAEVETVGDLCSVVKSIAKIGVA